MPDRRQPCEMGLTALDSVESRPVEFCFGVKGGWELKEKAAHRVRLRLCSALPVRNPDEIVELG